MGQHTSPKPCGRGERCCGLAPAFIELRKPKQKAKIERFNRIFRDDLLDAWDFTAKGDVRAITKA
jgi:hypothetical protein